MAVTKNLRDATIQFRDSGGTNTITLTLEEGDLKFTEKSNVVNILDRGVLDHQRQGDEEPVTGSMTLKFVEFIKQAAASAPTPYQVVKHSGAAASWVTTNTDGGDVWNFDIKITVDDPDATRTDETITLSKVHATEASFDEGADYNKLAFNFQAFVTTPTFAKA